MRYIIIIHCLLSALLSYSQLVPAHKAVKIFLEPNKKEFYPFEPIEIKVELINISDVNQHFVNADIGGRLKYTLKGGRKEFEFFTAFREIMNGEGGVEIKSKETEISPGEKKIGIVYPNKFYDLRNYYGDLEFTVGYPIIGEINGEPGYIIGRKSKSTKLKIVKEPVIESIPIKLFSEVIHKIMGANPLDKKIEENLLRIVTDYPNSYIIDQAHYFLSFYYYQLYESYKKLEQLEASKKYITEFLQRFPQSVYRKEGEGLEKMINTK